MKVLVPGNHLMVGLLGHRDELLRLVETAFPSTRIFVRGNEISIEGAQPEAENVGRLFGELVALLEQGHALDLANVGRTIEMVKAGEKPTEILTSDILRSARGRMVRPKTSGQKRYVDAISKNIVTFGIGPAGTGKSYLAVALACQALQRKEVERIILTRPAVEAGERLGFLPGDLMAKVDPYLRPLYDALFDMLGTEAVPKLMEKGAIEVAPLAFMRGRAQPVDTPVLTPGGFVAIGELEVGDLVVGSNGLPTPVLGVFPQGRKPVYRVSTQDGAATYACAEHLWLVRTPPDRRSGGAGRVLRTDEMIGKLRSDGMHRYELPLVGEVEFAPQQVPADPYLLGRLLGDPRAATPAMSSLVPAPRELAPAGGRGPTPGRAAVAVRELGGGVGRSSTTPVPRSYLFNTSAVRLALLQGLLDTDAATLRRDAARWLIEFSTTSPALLDDVVFLVRSLGGVARVRGRPDGRSGRGTGDGAVGAGNERYRLDIRLPSHLTAFRDAPKARRYAELGGARPARFVDSIEEAGDAECVCIAVGAADSLYVTSEFIVTHNTLNSSFIILDEAQNTTPEQMKMFLTRIGFGSKCVITGDITQIDLDGGKSGLVNLEPILQGIEDLAWVRLDAKDVVRHRIVAEIVDAYDRARASGVKV